MIRSNHRVLPTLVFVAVLLLASGVVSAQETARPLDGVHIYFSESSTEASIYDRSEEGISRIAGLLQGLGAELFTLNWRNDVPADADLIIMAGPARDLSPEQIVRLWVYLVNGGRLLLFAEPLVIDVSEEVISIEGNRALTSSRGFFELTWADFGIRGRDDVLILNDPSTFSTESAQDLEIEFAATPSEDSVVSVDQDSTLEFFGARSIEYDGSIQPYRATPLLLASPDFYGETAFGDFVESGIIEFNQGQDTATQLAVAVAVEQTIFDARLIIIGDRQFVSNGGGLQTSPPNSPNFVYPGNVQFVLNSVGWLLGIEASLPIPIEFSSPAAAPATPEATLEAAPEATTEPAPEATPEATAEPAPEATPEAQPEATPEATPESEGP